MAAKKTTKAGKAQSKTSTKAAAAKATTRTTKRPSARGSAPRAARRAPGGPAPMTRAAVIAALSGSPRPLVIKEGSPRLKEALAARTSSGGARFVGARGMAVSRVLAAAEMLARAIDDVCAQHPDECPAMYLEIAVQQQ